MPHRADDIDRLWRGFRRPIWRDRAFWVAVAVSIVAVMVEGGLATAAGIGAWWAVGLVAVFVVIAVFSIVGSVAGSWRGLRTGLRERPEPKATTRTSDDVPPAERAERRGSDATERAAKAVTDLSATARTAAAKVRTPTSDDVDRTARKLGRAFGAARKALRDE
jgi:hypothetical protein